MSSSLAKVECPSYISPGVEMIVVVVSVEPAVNAVDGLTMAVLC
jgi:hypothetical protein